MAPLLIPTPKRLRPDDGNFDLKLPASAYPLRPGDLPRFLPPGSLQLAPLEHPERAAVSPAGAAEAYEIDCRPDSLRVRAASPEGLLRAEATLLQMVRRDRERLCIPCCQVLDWPDFRYRCASDWLLNCEINRWSYDHGDGPEAYLARILRKLDSCFRHKINQVWFDGFGWDLARTPHYADLVRACNRHARQRGIRLTFAGYGGGYGTSYQTSELYRCGYQGRVFRNRRPWPDGPEYDCTGCDVPHSRVYGTCPSNEGLQAAKLAEMSAFVAAVEPGFMYIHDVDTGTYEASRQSWLWRCEDCRRRWPSDEMADPEGHAGAYAAWFRQIEETLQAVPGSAGYQAARDLAIIHASPVYTTYYEGGQPEVWEQEVEYFRVLSECLGPHANVGFALREQFYREAGGKRIAGLRGVLDAVGNGHGLYVIAFAGGDNYLTDDLCNISGALAPLYEGAQSVCLSNGGIHEEPVQVLNAEFLWNSAADGFRVDPGDPAVLATSFERICRGHWRPEELFGEGRLLHRICRHLWGEAPGDAMYEAYLCGGESGCGPVSRVWWGVTREVRRLMGDPVSGPAWTWRSMQEHWQQRLAATRAALALAREAAAAAAVLDARDDLGWFARCLEVGEGFAEVLALAYTWRAAADEGDDTAEASRLAALDRLTKLSEHLAANFTFEPTDVLGGDPGCWRETVAAPRRPADRSSRRHPMIRKALFALLTVTATGALAQDSPGASSAPSAEVSTKLATTNVYVIGALVLAVLAIVLALVLRRPPAKTE